MSAPTFDETQHPRGEGGRFTAKPASEADPSSLNPPGPRTPEELRSALAQRFAHRPEDLHVSHDGNVALPAGDGAVVVRFDDDPRHGPTWSVGEVQAGEEDGPEFDADYTDYDEMVQETRFRLPPRTMEDLADRLGEDLGSANRPRKDYYGGWSVETDHGQIDLELLQDDDGSVTYRLDDRDIGPPDRAGVALWDRGRGADTADYDALLSELEDRV